MHRGLLVLETVAEAPEGRTVAELSSGLGVHRAVIYRVVATLTEHGLLSRGDDGRYRLGPGVLRLARQALPHLRDAALPQMRRLAEDVGATAFLSVAEGEEAVAVAVVEPHTTVFHVAYRVGSRHPLDRGAPGIAILAGRPPTPHDPPRVAAARQAGYALTSDELQSGAVGIAAPLRLRGRPVEASLGVVTLGELDVPAAARHVLAACRAIAARLEGPDSPDP